MKRKALKQHYMGLGVSDHALVRYLQRVKGIDIDALKEEMIEENVVRCYSALGDGVYPSNHYRLVIKNSTVVTCLQKRAS